MRGLLLAEWQKTRGRPLAWGSAALLLGVVSLAIVGLTVRAALGHPGHGGGGGKSALFFAGESFPFPRGVHFALEIVGRLVPLWGVAFFATLVGSEYGQDTWKLILPRRAGRAGFVVAKLGVGWVSAWAICIGVLVWAQLLALGCAAWLHLPLLGDGSELELGPLVGALGLLAVQLLVAGSIGTLAALVTRSTVAGVVGGVVFTQVLHVLAQLVSELRPAMPSVHLENLAAHWVDPDGEGVEQVRSLLGHGLSASTSLAVLGLWIAAALLLSFTVFRRRDVG